MQTVDALETLFAVEDQVGEFVAVFGCPPRKVLVGLMQMRALENLAATDRSGTFVRSPTACGSLIVAGVPVATGSLDPEVVAVGW